MNCSRVRAGIPQRLYREPGKLTIANWANCSRQLPFAGADRPPYNTHPTRRMMAQPIRIGIMGAGWPGQKHAEGYKGAGGFEVTAVADLIPSRRRAVVQ